jgi:aspartate racemase
MKRIGLLGGISWESSAHYYSVINELVAQRLGGLHSADCVMVSVDFATIEAMQRAGQWSEAGDYLADRAVALESAGADFVVVCANTMHKVAPQIEAAIRIPLLHIGDVTASAVLAAGITTVGLLGTRFTMEEDFYIDRLTSRGLTVLVPSADQRAMVDRVVFEELVLGIVRDESRDDYVAVIESLSQRGAEGVILGCTEIELLISAADVAVPIFPTAQIHSEAAVDLALGLLPE